MPVSSNSKDYLNALECMHYDFWHYRYCIRSARESRKIRRCLQAVHNYKANKIPGEIKKKLKDLKKNVSAMYRYDYTREKLDNDLKKMVEALTEAIRTENPAWEIPDNYIHWPEE